nr:DUF1614 domain-containing protein [Dissulfurirhabdus thermomarina]
MAVLFVVVHVGLITVAFDRIGLPPGAVFGVLLASLLGSRVNIPVRRLETGAVAPAARIRALGVTFRVPAAFRPGTVVAVNVGGALVPLLLSAYLMWRWGLWGPPLLGAALVAAAVYPLARPVPGLGIVLPLFVPPVLGAMAGLLLAPPGGAPVVAYVAGTMGTLAGADLLHLKDVRRLGAPVAAIGGAGTFDGIFLSGVLAVLLA